MKIKPIVIVICAACIQACASSLMKFAMSLKTQDGLWLTVVLMAVAFGAFFMGFSLYRKSLRQLKLNIAQPVFSSMMFVASTCLSLVVFRESISLKGFIGMAVIIGGIALVLSASRVKKADNAAIADEKTAL